MPLGGSSAADSFYVANKNGKILNVNKHACDELGYSHGELTSMYLRDIDVSIIERRRQQIKAMIKNEPVTFETYHRRKDGTQFPVEIRGGYYHIGGEAIFVSVARNYSERKNRMNSCD